MSYLKSIFLKEIFELNFSVVDIDGENTTAAIICTSGSTGEPKGEQQIY